MVQRHNCQLMHMVSVLDYADKPTKGVVKQIGWLDVMLDPAPTSSYEKAR